MIDYYDGGDVNEDFTFSLLDVRPRMTNWCDVRKKNWLDYRVSPEAFIDRSKVRYVTYDMLHIICSIGTDSKHRKWHASTF